MKAQVTSSGNEVSPKDEKAEVKILLSNILKPTLAFLKEITDGASCVVEDHYQRKSLDQVAARASCYLFYLQSLAIFEGALYRSLQRSELCK